MKKLFLIPLMTLMTCVMAWGESTHDAGTFAELKSALSAAANGDIIKLTADINYGYSEAAGAVNITKSITIDGQGHTLTGASKRPNGAAQYATIWVNAGGANLVDVTFRDLTVVNAYNNSSNYAYAIHLRENINSITCENVVLDITNSAKGNSSTIQRGGSETNLADVTLNNCKLLNKNSDYPLITWGPVNITANNSYFSGYCGLYFKDGSRGSIVNADACNFDCPNVHSGESNAFSCFPISDDGITLNLHNCGINNQQIGDQNQALVTIGNDGYGTNRHALPININISGDNSHINVGGGMNNTIQNLWGYNTSAKASKDYNDFADINVTISGGTYSVHPQSYDMAAYGHWNIEDDQIKTVQLIFPEIPATDTVQEINQGGVTLYRIVKKAAKKEIVDPEDESKTIEVLYDLNDLVANEGIEEGNNPISSFDLSVGYTMKLNQDTTKAGYVQVSDKIVEDPITHEKDTTATIIQVGKTEVNPSTSKEEKVDQTLVINNGLDVQGESQVIVQAGSAIVIGEGGINTEKPENIVIEADSTGAASLLLDPTITVNQTPNLTVRMTARQIGRDASNDWYWHRFAMPVDHIDMWEKEGSLAPAIANNYPTYVYAWDYENNDWANIAPSEMEPLQGYTLTLNSKNIAGSAADGKLNVLQDVVYIFKGNLVGNTDRGLNFQHEGFNFFGNSYTGYMDVLTVIQGIESDFVDGTVYMWNNDPSDKDYQTYKSVTLYQLTNARQRAKLKTWQKEVAPMQTFIMRLRGADSANESVSYADAIWGNPRYGNSSSPAPKRKLNTHNGGANDPEQAYFEIVITAANGSADRVEFTELNGLSDAFENGYDAEKFMNEKHFNIYSTLSGVNMSTVVTDHLLGKTLSLQTLDDVNYTISFEYVEGNAYALLDKATNTLINIDNATTYNFSAQPNSTIEGRFEIVERYMVPTGIDQVEGNTNMKGIYTLLGQYVGEDFNALPAGVYIVNGVKVVK